MGGKARGLAAAVLIAAGCIGVSAAKAQGGATITHPDWVRRPTAEDVSHHYPKLAQRLEIEGRAVISCTVDADGKLKGCAAVSESPREVGFGPAAVAMAIHFEMRPKTLNGIPVSGGTVRIPIRFKLPSPEPDPNAAAGPKSDAAATNPRAAPAVIEAAGRLVDARRLVEVYLDALEADIRRMEFVGSDTAPRASRGAAADALREAAKTHRQALRDGYASAFASVFTAEELMALAAYAEGDTAKAMSNSGVMRDMAPLVFRNALQAWRDAARKAFCEKASCLDAAEVAKAWRASDRKPSHLDNPQWVSSPSVTRLRNARPPVATFMNLPGIARMRCGVDADGQLQGCEVEAASPRDLGFEKAALELATAYRLSPMQLPPYGATTSVIVRVGFPAAEDPEPFEPPPPRSETALALAYDLVAAFDAKAGLEAADPARSGIDEPADATPGERAARTAIVEALPAAVKGLEDQLARAMAAAYEERHLADAVRQQGEEAAKAEKARQEPLTLALEAAWRDVSQQITRDARAAFCKSRGCDAPDAGDQSAANPEPSTRNP